MAVYFSGACASETNGINGTVGDQTGNEIRTRTAYTHSLGWRVFRYPNANIAKWIGINAKSIADNNNYGYGQNNRTTGYNAAKSAGWEPKRVTTKCNLDCSEMVRTCVACALEKDIPDFSTSNEASVLLNLGFKEIAYNVNNLQVGDILVTRSAGHTETVSAVDGQSSSSGSTTSSSTTPIYAAATANGWLPTVKGNSSYAGNEGQAIYKFMVKNENGTSVKYRAYCGGRWLPWCTGFSQTDHNNGYAGDGKNPITAIQVEGKTYKVSTVKSSAYYSAVSSITNYAGDAKNAIDKIMIW